MSIGCDNGSNLIHPAPNEKTSPHCPGSPRWCTMMKYWLMKLSQTDTLGETGDLLIDYIISSGRASSGTDECKHHSPPDIKCIWGDQNAHHILPSPRRRNGRKIQQNLTSDVVVVCRPQSRLGTVPSSGALCLPLSNSSFHRILSICTYVWTTPPEV